MVPVRTVQVRVIKVMAAQVQQVRVIRMMAAQVQQVRVIRAAAQVQMKINPVWEHHRIWMDHPVEIRRLRI